MWARVGVAWIGCLLSGCSWLFVTPAPENHPHMRYFDGTTRRAAPFVDTLVAGLYRGSAAATAAGERGFNSHGDFDEPTAIAVIVGFVLIEGASAYYGFTTTDECDEAKDLLQQRRINAPP